MKDSNSKIQKHIFLTRVLDGEYQLCIKISDPVYDDIAGIKSIKTKLFFSNEYYNRKNLRIIFTVANVDGKKSKTQNTGKVE